MMEIAKKTGMKKAKTIIVLMVLALSKALAFASSILIARLFSKEDAGVVFFVTGLVVLSMPFTTMGLSAAANFFYARNVKRGRGYRNFQILNLAAIVAILPSITFGLLSLVMGEAISTLWLITMAAIAISCYFAAFRQLARNFFAIQGHRAWGIAHESIIFNLALAGCLIALPEKSADMALAAVAIASVLSGALALWQLYRATKDQNSSAGALPPAKYTRQILRLSVPSMVAQAGATLLNKIDVIMIAPLAGAAAVGDYSVALRLTYITTAVGEVVTALAITRLAQAAASGDKRKIWALAKRVTKIQVVLTILVAIPLFIVSGWLIPALYGAEFSTATPSFIILQAGKLLTAVYAPALILFTGLGYNREMAKNAMFAAAVNIALNAVLVPAYGATGASVATLVALVMMCALYTRLFIRIRAASRAAE